MSKQNTPPPGGVGLFGRATAYAQAVITGEIIAGKVDSMFELCYGDSIAASPARRKGEPYSLLQHILGTPKGGVTMSVKIPLTRNMFAIVDESDFDLVSKHKWNAAKGGRGGYYASTRIYVPHGKSYNIKMHRMITSAPDGLDVDHINGNSLDNRRVNLRVCSHKDNSHNQVRLCSNNKSGYNGISWNKERKKWRARIKVDGKEIHLGRFDKLSDAVYARRSAELHCYGEFAPVISNG